MNAPSKILIAGIGNIFLGDDAFGSDVAQRLLRKTFPAGTQVLDFGIRGLDLVYALLENPQTLILIDAVPRGESPGTLYILDPQLDQFEPAPPVIEAHSMDPLKVLQTAVSMGAKLNQVFIIGCEPTPGINYDDPAAPMEMSPAVAAAIEPAVALVESLLEQVMANTHTETEVSSCTR